MLSNDELTGALTTAADDVVSAAAPFPRPRILIDGRSGAGKSTLARMVATRLGATLLALDSLYPGWDGLAVGAEAARIGVLAEVDAGRDGLWRRWDWARGEPAEEHRVSHERALVIEGSGVLTPASVLLSDVGVWVDAPAAARRERALRRDGETYRPHWERWAAQEEVHIRNHAPRSLAGVVVDLP